jgi:hypothetical protein
MSPLLQPIKERVGIDVATFRAEIARTYEPCVMRGLVADWPAVEAARGSTQDLLAYVQRFDRGRPAPTFVGPAAINGRYFYAESGGGLNFEQRPSPVAGTLMLLTNLASQDAPPSVYSGSVLIPEHLPGFEADNRLDILAPDVRPRLWIGNRSQIAAHFDASDNVACVVAGRRRFTLFPPDQVHNLYVGPFDQTVAGQPVSMVSLEEPDFDRYPRFRQALAAGLTAELGPGDAIFIPALWWHAVRALDPVNALVNYWWSDTPDSEAAFEALVHGLLTVSGQAPAWREGWRALFEHYVFRRDGDPAEHLPPERKGVLGPLGPQLRARIKGFLQHRFARA